MLLTAFAEKLKRRAKDDFKGRHFEPWLIIQAVSWYLRYPLSCRDVEKRLIPMHSARSHPRPAWALCGHLPGTRRERRRTAGLSSHNRPNPGASHSQYAKARAPLGKRLDRSVALEAVGRADALAEDQLRH
jgi:hypothetical protein